MSRIEDMLQGIIDGTDPSELPEPQSRVEGILEGILEGTDVSDMPAPQSRVEALLLGVLDKINKGGGGGGGLEFETGTFAPSSNVEVPTIAFSNAHSTAPMLALIADSVGSTSTDNTWLLSCVVYSSLFAVPVQTSASTYYEAIKINSYRGYRGSYVANTNFLAESEATKLKPSTYVTSSVFKPASAELTSGIMWRSGRTYKWIAVWAPEE